MKKSGYRIHIKLDILEVVLGFCFFFFCQYNKILPTSWLMNNINLLLTEGLGSPISSLWLCFGETPPGSQPSHWVLTWEMG